MAAGNHGRSKARPLTSVAAEKQGARRIGRRRVRATATVIVVAFGIALSACAPPSEVVEGTAVAVALDQPFTSYNPNTAYGSSGGANASIAAATNSSFNAYDETPKLVRDESFGSYLLVSADPLVVKYTIRDGVRWSDGTPVDAADMLLAWAANSTSLNDTEFAPAEFTDPETGEFTSDFPRDGVYFDGFTGNGLQLVTETPIIGDDGRSLTLAYDEYFADWQLVFEVGLPAHVVAKHALNATADAAKDAIVTAIETRDREALAAISRFWNSGFNLESTPKNTDLLLSTGPYTITEIAENQVTLESNPRYRGDRLPSIEKVLLRFISDPLQAVAALQTGEVDVIAPRASQDVVAALAALDGVTVEHGFGGAWERLDLQFTDSRSGHFSNPLIREAFLKVVPRQQILDALITPVNPGAELRSSHVFLPGAKGYEASVEENGSTEFDRVDVPAARRLLAEAALLDPSLANPTVCILFDAAIPRRVAEFQLIQDTAARAGFQVTDCSSPDWRNLLGTPGAYDAALYALSETNLAAAAAQALFASDSRINNHAHYANPKVDDLLFELGSPAGAESRTELLAEIDRIVWNDFAGIPLYQFPTVTATSGRVKAVTHSPLEPTALWNPWQWEPVLAE